MMIKMITTIKVSFFLSFFGMEWNLNIYIYMVMIYKISKSRMINELRVVVYGLHPAIHYCSSLVTIFFLRNSLCRL